DARSAKWCRHHNLVVHRLPLVHCQRSRLLPNIHYAIGRNTYPCASLKSAPTRGHPSTPSLALPQYRPGRWQERVPGHCAFSALQYQELAHSLLGRCGYPRMTPSRWWCHCSLTYLISCLRELIFNLVDGHFTKVEDRCR